MRIFLVLAPALFIMSGAFEAMAQTTLAGTTWVMSAAGKRPPSISFEAGGKVAGSGGCNRFFGSYTQDGEVLGFSPLGATRMACPEGVMKLEQDFFNMLGEVRRAKVEASKLLLFDASGREIARLTRRSGE